MPDVRPMTEADVEGVVEVMDAAFGDLARRFGFPYEPRAAAGPGGPAQRRVLRCLTSTPAGAWVSTGQAGLTGAALAIVRDGLWGLSLLVVDPVAQSAGAGRALLAAALGAAEGTHGGIILASEDVRALRAYARAGFDLRPVLHAAGPVRHVPEPPAAVRAGRWPQDRGLCDAASRAVRGVAHGEDLATMLAVPAARLLVHDAGGFAVVHGARVSVLAAHAQEPARELLRAALAALADEPRAEVEFLDADQQWAFDELVEAGLDLHPGGAICVRGEVGPLRPYVPSGAYL